MIKKKIPKLFCILFICLFGFIACYFGISRISAIAYLNKIINKPIYPGKAEASYIEYLEHNDDNYSAVDQEITYKISESELTYLYSLLGNNIKWRPCSIFSNNSNIPYYLELVFENENEIMFWINTNKEITIAINDKYFKTQSDVVFEYLHGFIRDKKETLNEIGNINEIILYYRNDGEKELLITDKNKIEEIVGILKNKSHIKTTYRATFVSDAVLNSNTDKTYIKLLDINSVVNGEEKYATFIVNGLYWYKNKVLYEKLYELIQIN